MAIPIWHIRENLGWRWHWNWVGKVGVRAFQDIIAQGRPDTFRSHDGRDGKSALCLGVGPVSGELGQLLESLACVPTIFAFALVTGAGRGYEAVGEP